MSTSAQLDPGRYYLDAAYLYADNVRSGKQIAGTYVRLAVDRYYRDLQFAGERGYVFDENAAAEVFRFVYKYCKHYMGEWAGKPIEFSPWQCFGIANVFGWVHRDTGFRRFRNVYEEVARKNGKTTKLAAVGAYLAAGDNEPGSKVYCAATKRDQAREIFDSIGMMAKQDPVLSRAMLPQRNSIICNTKNSPSSRVELLSADYDTMDGFNVHAALVDELHAHKDSGVWDVLESARGARRQPLMWGITTAGKDHNGFCYEMRAYAIKILEQSIAPAECDTTFAIIYTLDEPKEDDDPGDDWTDPAVWQKANPNLGVSVSYDDLLQQCQKAKEMPTAAVEFKTKRMNVWVYGVTAWMNMERFNQARNLELNERQYWDDEGVSDMDGAVCHGAIDLASVEDLTALTLDFKRPDGVHRFISRGYLPELAFEKRRKMGGHIKALYQKFVDRGELIITPGEVCDYEFIKKDIHQAASRFDLKEVAFDRWNSSQLVTDLIEDEIPMVSMGQGTGSISSPMKEMLRLTLAKQIEHNNELLTFAMSNVVAVVNAAGDIKYDKSKVSEKIDPAAAAIMALGRAMNVEDDRSEAIDDFLNEPIHL